MSRVCPLLCAIMFAFATHAKADVFFTDGFDYADGQLTSEDPTESGLGDNVSGGLWTTHSGGGSGGDGEYVDVVGGQAELLIDGSEDVNRLTGRTMNEGETWYYGSIFTVNDTRTGTAGLDGEYFIHFYNGLASAATRFTGRVSIDDPVFGETGYTLELESSSSTGTPPEVPWVADLEFGTPYAIMVSYEVDTGFTSLWVNPTGLDSTSISDLNPNPNALDVEVNSLGLRQGNNSNNPSHQVLVDKVSAGDDFDEVLAALDFSVDLPDADFDDDLDVDADDLLTWQAGYGAPATGTSGDADGDSDADGSDFLVWQNTFTGSIVDPSLTSVPEPASLMLLCVAVGLASMRRIA